MPVEELEFHYADFCANINLARGVGINVIGKRGQKKLGKRTVRNRRINRMSMVAIGMVVMLLLVILLVQGNSLKTQLTIYAAEQSSLEEKIENETMRTEEIDKLKDYMQTDDYAEEVAREKLGLVKDNEIVFQESDESAK